jgi:Cu-Zn family superoxide dismutase
MPALLVDRQGNGSATFATDRFQVRQLFDDDGSAVIIHADPDNQANIPDRYGRAADPADPGSETANGPDDETRRGGDSGEHIACGVIGGR